jgi:hypothetical protein
VLCPCVAGKTGANLGSAGATAKLRDPERPQVLYFWRGVTLATHPVWGAGFSRSLPEASVHPKGVSWGSISFLFVHFSF